MIIADYNDEEINLYKIKMNVIMSDKEVFICEDFKA